MIFLALSLPLPSSCNSTTTSPCQPRICAIFGYCLCLPIAPHKVLPYRPLASSSSAWLGPVSGGGVGVTTIAGGIVVGVASGLGVTAITSAGGATLAGG